MMKYKGYTATVEYDPSINLLHGRVDNIQGVISFSASSTEDLLREFEASVDDYLSLCEEHHLEPEKPYSGRLVLRLEPGVHRAIAIAAKHKNQSLNTWITCTLKKELNWANGQPDEALQATGIDLRMLGRALNDFMKQRDSRPGAVEPHAQVPHRLSEGALRYSLGRHPVKGRGR